MKKTIIGIGVAATIAYAGASLPVTVESIPARAITTSGTGCFELQSNGTVRDISQQEYDSFALKGARPVIKAWCGTKFDTPERQPQVGDYWDTPNGRQVFIHGRPRKVEGDINIGGGSVNITEPLIQAITPKAEAYITYQNIGDGATTDTNTITTAFDVGSGANRMLNVNVVTWDADGFSDCVVSSIKYAGVDLAKAKAQNGYSGTNNMVEDWYLAAPTTGSNNVVTTTAGTCSSLNHEFIALNGVKQTGQPDSTNGGLCTTAATTDFCYATTTTVANNSWTIGASGFETCGTFNATSSSERTDAGCYVDTSGDANPAQFVTHGFTDNTAGERWVWTMVSFSPDTTDTTNVTDFFTIPGTYTWTAPTGVTQVFASCWGGGGGGGDGTNTGGGGGGGGGYASTTVSVTAGNNYTVVVGGGGEHATGAAGNGFSGATSTFNSNSVVASPGNGGKGASSASGAGGRGGLVTLMTGTVKYNGGGGGASNNTGDTGGGGGGAGGINGDGATSTAAGTTAGSNGAQGDNGSGGLGGAGGNTNYGANGAQNKLGGGGGGGGDDTFAGGNGGAPGGGGGGGENNSAVTYGNGADGRCELNYLVTAAAGAPGKAETIFMNYWM